MHKKFDPVLYHVLTFMRKLNSCAVHLVVTVTFEIIITIILPPEQKCGHRSCATLTMHFCSILGERAWFAYTTKS